MALTKTITANGSRGHHQFTLEVIESSTRENNSYLDFSFKISAIQSGWDWSGWGNKIAYNINVGGNVYNGSIPSYNGSSTVTLKSVNGIIIPHNPDGTKTINISFDVVDGAGQTYTCGNASSSSTFTLSQLHKAPVINSVSLTELNTELTDLSMPDETIAQYLSSKRFTVNATLYDSATLSSFKIYHNNTLIGQSNNNQIEIDFAEIGELKTTKIDNDFYTTLNYEIIDSKNGTATKNEGYITLKYINPTIERTTTTIKRKSGYDTTLTANKAELNLVSTVYKNTSDILGINNEITVEYKIWQDGTTEPSYTTISNPTITPVQDNPLLSSVTVSNMELSNIIYTSVYYYKIKITDIFGNVDEKSDRVPTGISVWSEYPDHVNFMALTVNEVNPFSVISNEERIIGTWMGKPLYQKTITETTTAVDTRYDPSRYGLSNIKECIVDNQHSYAHYKTGSPLEYHDGRGYIGVNAFLSTTDSKAFYLDGAGNFTYKSGYVDEIKWVVTILYTKTTD